MKFVYTLIQELINGRKKTSRTTKTTPTTLAASKTATTTLTIAVKAINKPTVKATTDQQ